MNPSELKTGFFIVCFVFSKGLFQRKLAQSISHCCQLLSALFPCDRIWRPVRSVVPISVLNMHQWLPERLCMRNCCHPLSNWNKEAGHCVHWFDKGLTCFLYCKVVMGSFITLRAPWHFMLGKDASVSFQELACQMVRKEGMGARQEW